MKWFRNYFGNGLSFRFLSAEYLVFVQMQFLRLNFTGIILLTLFYSSCKSPFSTKPTEDEIFAVSHNYTGSRVLHSTPVKIEWSNITIKQFKEFLVERLVTTSAGAVWEERARISDSLSTEYEDIIDDDATFQYRVRIVDQNDEFIVALAEPFTVPPVSVLSVPLNYSNPQLAFNTKFIDNGDTINVSPGVYRGHFEFMGKNVLIRSVMIPVITVLSGVSETGSVVRMNGGVLDGFTVFGGVAFYGGGIHADSSAVIKNCIINHNRATIDPEANIQIYPNGMGGGVYLQGDAKLISSRISRNISQREGGGILCDGNNEIRNCTIDNNAIYLSGLYSGGGVHQEEGFLQVRNTKFKHNSAEGFGGAINGQGEIDVLNCLFEKNISTKGGSLFIGATSKAAIVNCVFYKNQSSGRSYSGAIGRVGDVSIINTIVWKNGGRNDYKLYPKVATYSNSDEFRIVFGTGNLMADPLFEDPANGNFHLLPDSPCADAGSSEGVYTDTDGSTNDMGIYGGPFGDDW